MSAEVVFQQMIIICLLMLTGYIIYKKGLVGDAVSPGISAIVVNVCSPAMLIHSCLERDPAITNEKLLLSLGGGAIIYAVLIASSFIIPRILRVEKKWKNHYALMCIFGNTGFIGIPLILAVLGERALIYTVVINVYYSLFFYTYGYYLAGGEDTSFQPEKLINIGNISLVIAVVLFLTQPKVPLLIEQTLGYMANATILLAILVIGISLARTDFRSIFTEKKLYLFIVLRFILTPVLLAMVLKLFIKDELMLGVLVILSAVPVGNLPLMRVEETGGDGTVLAKGTILSTVLAVITVPIVTLFL